MTYDSGWLKRRVSAAANEYDKWPDSVKQATKLNSNGQTSANDGHASGDNSQQEKRITA